MQYNSIKKKYLQPLEKQDKSLAALYQKYEKLRQKRRVQQILVKRKLDALKLKPDASIAEKQLIGFLENADKEDQKLTLEFANAYQAL